VKVNKNFVALLGFTPHLVFDRGFESPYLVPFLLKQKIPFTVYEGTRVRVVVSEKLSERIDSQGRVEPWYLVTNDFTSEKEVIVSRYYFRFEIEEAFKDLKYIQNLKKFYRIKKAQTFQTLLWFCILKIWLAFLLDGTKQYLRHRILQKK
jgi:hypothetical protein